MAKEYAVKRLDSSSYDNCIWNEIDSLCIDCYPWNLNGYMPVTKVKLLYTELCFHILFKSYEKNPMITYFRMNEPVWKDSCVEFFFNPDPENDERYLNFEVNAAGTLLLGIGNGRQNRLYINDVEPEIFNIRPLFSYEQSYSSNIESWSVEYCIPFNLIKKYYENFSVASGKKMAANFYKCGDETAYPHYGCWNPIEYSKPDFHRPEFFGTLII